MKLNNPRNHPTLSLLEREAERFCGQMFKNPQSGRMLVLAGSNGNGKSYTAKAIQAWVSSYGHGAQFMSGGRVCFLESQYFHWPNLLDRLKAGEWNIVTPMLSCPCLVLDEVGGEHDPSMVGVDKLCQILSHRENRWTVVTTNINPSMWEEKFDRRVASRFFRNSTLIDMSDVPDYATA